jgi:tRNA pseudouridine65 synthase
LNQNHLEILYQDEYLVAINKPNGLLVHRSPIAADASEFALQIVRDMLGRHVYPIHRLDRKTSGVLLFALDSVSARAFQQAMESDHAQKRYLAIVRGYFPGEINLNHPLTNDDGKTQEAETLFRCIKTTEIEIPFGKHSTSRYSLIEAFPKTGRMHQIRKHLDHLRHPIIGDRPWGCNKQNKLFLEKWELNNMMLHADSINIIHPFSNEKLFINANQPEEFLRIQKILSL